MKSFQRTPIESASTERPAALHGWEFDAAALFRPEARRDINPLFADLIPLVPPAASSAAVESVLGLAILPVIGCGAIVSFIHSVYSPGGGPDSPSHTEPRDEDCG